MKDRERKHQLFSNVHEIYENQETRGPNLMSTYSAPSSMNWSLNKFVKSLFKEAQ